MPKIVHAHPKYRRHKASGQAIVTLAGKDHYLGRYGTATSRAEYDRLVGEWLACGRSLPRVQAPEPVRIVELLAAYLRHAEQYYRKHGRPTRSIERTKMAMRILRAPYGHTLVSDFGPLALQAVRTALVNQGKSRPYVNCLIEEMKRIFKWGVAQELVPPEVHQGLATVAGLRRGRTDAPDPDPIRPVSDAHVELTIPHLPRIVAVMVKVQRLTGMRPGEVCIMRPVDIDRSAEVWQYRPSEHKTEHHGRERIVFIGPRAQEILLPYLLRDAESYCFSPRDSEEQRKSELRARRQSRVQPSQRDRRKRRPNRTPGDRYNVAAYDRAIARACRKAWPAPKELSLDQQKEWHRAHRWTPNQLRHAAATEIRSQFGLEPVQVILGHSHANVTQVYAERDAGRAIQVVRQVG